MTHEDSNWLELCKWKPERYKIVVDNDCLWVEDITDKNDPEVVHEFSDYGVDFIIQSFIVMGFNIDGC